MTKLVDLDAAVAAVQRVIDCYGITMLSVAEKADIVQALRSLPAFEPETKQPGLDAPQEDELRQVLLRYSKRGKSIKINDAITAIVTWQICARTSHLTAEIRAAGVLLGGDK